MATVTSRGPQDLLAFVRAIVEHFQGEAGKPIPSQRALVSAPQRQSPPVMVLRAMKSLPRPSLRTAAFMAALRRFTRSAFATGRLRRLPETVSADRLPARVIGSASPP